jgi:hypothetical protein
MLLRNAKILCLLADHLPRFREKCCGIGGYGVVIADWKFKQNAWRGQEFPKNNTRFTSCNTYEIVPSVSFILVYYVHQILSNWIKISASFYFQKIVLLRCVVQVQLYTLLTSLMYIRPHVVTERLHWVPETVTLNSALVCGVTTFEIHSGNFEV